MQIKPNIQTVFVGTVSWFDAEKGVGFIQRRSAPDIYARIREVVGAGFTTLAIGQKVEFTISRTAYGLEAKNIVPC